MTPKAEILAPISDWETCRAAVHNGAGAVYVGVPGFNARGRAPSLEIETLKEIIDFCHLHGVRVLLALNVLIFEEELSEITKLLAKLIPLSPDAFIVQDLGLARLIKYLAPAQKIHASTQMTVTSHHAISLTDDLDISRYVLGREVSLKEMEIIRQETKKELEVFVHGALCVSYSGQCLTSERIGGRSANRGQCAQSCRLPYDLIVDGEKKDLGDRRYLVSPKDLCALEDVEELLRIGIDSFKIEGRLKSAEYVASSVRSYSERVNAVAPHQTPDELALVYSRGFFNGWMDGVNHQELVDGRYPSHQGLEIGAIAEVVEEEVLINTTRDVSPGDGLLFCDFSRDEKCGGFIFRCERKKDGRLTVALSYDFPFEKLRPGMKVFLNSSPGLEKEIRRSFSEKERLHRVPVTFELVGECGSSLKLRATDLDRNVVTVQSESVLVPAEKSPLTEGSARKELSALMGSVFELDQFSFEVQGNVFVHTKELKRLRQRACELLSDIRQSRVLSEVKQISEVDAWRKTQVETFEAIESRTPELNLLIRDAHQIQNLVGLPISHVYLDYEFGKDYKSSIQELRALGFKVGIATTRILKPTESNHLKHIQKLAPDVILVRNLGALNELKSSGIPIVGDFSLNVANSLTASYLLDKGLTRLCPSYDLNHEQLISLFESLPASYFEVTVHQYMASFHMEHCVYAAFLSKGTSYRDCGRPCEKHQVELRAPDGTLHPLRADAECRNTMFNGVPQSAAKLLPELMRAGVAAFRVEALNESAQLVREKVEHYANYIFGNGEVAELISKLNLNERYGVSEGQLLNIRRYKDRVKEIRI